MPITKKAYINFAQLLTGQENGARGKLEVDNGKRGERNEKIVEFRLKVQLMANASQVVARIQSQVIVRDVEMTAMHVAMLRSTKSVECMTRY